MLELFIVSSFVGFALVGWFKTEAFQEYRILTEWIPGIGADHFERFDDKKVINIELTYLDYVKGIHEGTAFGKVISCPICLAFWMSMVGSIFVIPFASAPAITLLGAIAYYLVVALSKFADEDL
jgi:hypothetical protein